MTFEEWWIGVRPPGELASLNIKMAWDAAHAEGKREVLLPIKKLVDEQAKDEGLWFKAVTAPEGYLQQELRRLHMAIEKED